MSTPTTETKPKKKNAPKLYLWKPQNIEFKSQTDVINWLLSKGFLEVKDRIIKCQYCGVQLLPVAEAAHYFSKHRDKLQFSK